MDNDVNIATIECNGERYTIYKYTDGYIQLEHYGDTIDFENIEVIEALVTKMKEMANG